MSLGNFAYGGVQRSYSFPFAGIGRLPNVTSVTQMPAIDCEQVSFQAHPDNTDNVYIGTSASMGLIDSIIIEPGNWSPYIPVQNLELFYYVCGDSASYLNYLLVR